MRVAWASHLTSCTVCAQGDDPGHQKASGLKGEAPPRRRTLEGFAAGRNLADMAPASVGGDTLTAAGTEGAPPKHRSMGDAPSMLSGHLASVWPLTPPHHAVAHCHSPARMNELCPHGVHDLHRHDHQMM